MQGRKRPSPLFLKSRKLLGNDQLLLTVLAVFVGALTGWVALLFIDLINFFQSLFIGIRGEWLVAHLQSLPAWKVVLIPTFGGLLVGLFLYYFMPGRIPRGPADVIAACEVGGARISFREGLCAVIASAMSIGAGASVGREGPAVHLGASVAAQFGRFLSLTRSNSRVLLGCGVAAAVSASFNAPVAGALFAQEVILSHYALKAFAPVVISSVAATVVAHNVVGNIQAFEEVSYGVGSYLEFPAFGGLGLITGLLGVMFIISVLRTQQFMPRIPGPRWSKPAMGGFLIGLIALEFPHVLGVGYEATHAALSGSLTLQLLAGILVFKFLATIISLGFGFSGGVFSPSLVIGAMMGGVFGFGVAAFLPGEVSDISVYSLVGMAAMAAAVLGAPISTTLIVFELTGNYELSMAVMFACVLSTLMVNQLGYQSFFLEQLKGRGVDLMNNYSNLVLSQIKVDTIPKKEGAYVSLDAPLDHVRRKLRESPSGTVYVINHDRSLYGAVHWRHLSEDYLDPVLNKLVIAADLCDRQPPVLHEGDTLEIALSVFEESGVNEIPILATDGCRAYVGCMDQRDVMHAYNQALIRKRKQEQGLA